MAKKHTVQIWPVANNGKVAYPEKSLSRYNNKQNVGVCFSGGGTRSATASLGQMRALRYLGYDSQIKYISCISGGSWFAVPYTFLPDSCSDSDFLGEYKPNDLIGLSKKGNTKYFDETINKTHNRFANCVKNADMINTWVLDTLSDASKTTNWRWRNNKVFIHEVWGNILYEIFLKPFRRDKDEPRGENPPPQRYIALSKQNAQGISSRNEHLAVTDFQWPREGRPFLIVGGTIMRKKTINMVLEAFKDSDEPVRDLFTINHDWDKFFFPVEYTPYYSGTPKLFSGEETYGRISIGGGHIETFGINSKDPSGKLDKKWVEVKFDSDEQHRFSPQDMMAVSGAAPAAHALWYRPIAKLLGLPRVKDSKRGIIAKRIKTFIRKLPDIFPNYRSWPLVVGERASEDKLPYGDGGFVDNYGIMPLLRRQVPRIVAFVNSEVPLELPISAGDDNRFTTVQIADMLTNPKLREKIQIDGGLPILFGQEDLANDVTSVWAKDTNHVFSTETKSHKGKNYSCAFADTIKGLAEAKLSGGPVCFRRRYKVQRNVFHGIFAKTAQGAEYEVEVLWFYSDFCSDFVQEKFNGEARDYFNQQLKNGELKEFPHYSTFLPAGQSDGLENASAMERFIDKVEPVKLNHNQVVALANLSAWAVDKANQKRLFKGFFR